MDLTDEERALVERHRAVKEAQRRKWSPLALDAITPDIALVAIRRIHEMALDHFNGVSGGRACDGGCDCKQYIYEAAMETLALPGDGQRMWDEYNARHR